MVGDRRPAWREDGLESLGLEGTEAIVFRNARLKPGLELAVGDSRRPLSVGLRIIDYFLLDNPNR